jgi:glycosyltransferase involved in cell wall biosynthesis
LRVYHAGRDPAHRRRDHALRRLGVEVTLVVPQSWPEPGAQAVLDADASFVRTLPVSRAGDVNRHRYRVADRVLAALVQECAPDLLDLHEEPFSAVSRQWLRVVRDDLPVVAYAAQNLDKRLPPPFAQHEARALARLNGLYPCSRQAASVLVGKGFGGRVQVLPLGYDESVWWPREAGTGVAPALVLAGRLVPEKGVLDAIRLLHLLGPAHAAIRLVLAGDGPAIPLARRLAADLGVADRVEHRPWLGEEGLAHVVRHAAAVLVPSHSTERWAEQFGRVVVEAQASGTVVCAYASGALPEVVGGAGVLVPEGDVTAMAAAVGLVLADTGEQRRLREAGIAAARARTWDRVAFGQVGLYRDVLDGWPGSIAPGVRRRGDRRQAVERYGSPARPASGVERPFADPVLRRLGPAQRPLGDALDALARLQA